MAILDNENLEPLTRPGFCTVQASVDSRLPPKRAARKSGRHNPHLLVVWRWLLQRDKHLNDAFSFGQWLQCFSYHSSKHLAPVGAFHCVSGSR